MIFGTVLQSRDLGRYKGYDLALFMVENSDYPSGKRNQTVVSVTCVAMRNGVTLGGFDVPYVMHHKTKPRKHAFNRVNVNMLKKCAVEDAQETLRGLAS